MSRFNKLEIHPLRQDQQPEQNTRPKDEPYFLEQAELALRQGQFEKSLRCYSKVLEHNPRNPAAWVGQVRMLIELEEFSEAGMWADKALEMFPNDPELLAAKGSALARAGDAQAALAFSDASMAQPGQSAYRWLARGDVLLARQESRASYCFEQASAAQAGDWLILCLISRVYSFYQNFALALKWAQQALALSAAESLAWLQLGRCQAALGLFAQARNAFEQARELAPQSAEPEKALRELSEAGLGGKVQGWWRRLFQR